MGEIGERGREIGIMERAGKLFRQGKEKGVN
jgi:hypothetical protein